jgi:hypothetical protein
MIGGKDIVWKEYVQHLRGLLFHIGECQRDVQDIQTSIMVSKTFRMFSGVIEKYNTD